MSFFLTDAISSALTPRGQNDALNRNSNNISSQGIFANALKAYNPLLQQQMQFGQSLEPMRQSNILQGISSLGQGGVDAGIREYNAGANERAGQQAKQEGLLLGSQGYGSGAVQGATQGAYNAAQASTNAFAQSQQSPQAKAQRLQMILNLIQGGMSPSALAPMLQLSSGVYGTPAPYVGQSPASQIGQLAGMAGGMPTHTAGPTSVPTPTGGWGTIF